MSTILKQTLGVSAGLGVVAVGAWFATLRTLCADLASLRAQASIQQVALAGAPALDPDHSKVIADLEARIARSHAILDATPPIDTLYEVIQSAGKKADVRVERLEPSSSARKPVDFSKTTGYMAETLTFDIEISGDFDRVILFLASIERDLGLSKVASVRAQPMPGQNDSGSKIVAQISTAHFIATPASSPEKNRAKAAFRKETP